MTCDVCGAPAKRKLFLAPRNRTFFRCKTHFDELFTLPNLRTKAQIREAKLKYWKITVLR